MSPRKINSVVFLLDNEYTVVFVTSYINCTVIGVYLFLVITDYAQECVEGQKFIFNYFNQA